MFPIIDANAIFNFNAAYLNIAGANCFYEVHCCNIKHVAAKKVSFLALWMGPFLGAYHITHLSIGPSDLKQNGAQENIHFLAQFLIAFLVVSLFIL